MTTIAFDGKTISADGRAIAAGGYIVSSNENKLYVPKNKKFLGEKILVMAASGVSGLDRALFEEIEQYDSCYKAHSKRPTIKTPVTSSDCVDAVIITDKGVYRFFNDLYYWRHTEPILVLGSGSKFALSALHLGLNSKEAIAHASLFDPNTGGNITTIKVR